MNNRLCTQLKKLNNLSKVNQLSFHLEELDLCDDYTSYNLVANKDSFKPVTLVTPDEAEYVLEGMIRGLKLQEQLVLKIAHILTDMDKEDLTIAEKQILQLIS